MWIADPPSDLLNGLTPTDHNYCDPGFELGAVSVALAHRWEPLFRDGAPPQRLTMGLAQKNRPPQAPTKHSHHVARFRVM